MKKLIVMLMLACSAFGSEQYMVVRESSGKVPVGTTLQWVTEEQAYTNGQYSARMFVNLTFIATNSSGEVVQYEAPHCVFWDKTDQYLWDKSSNWVYQTESDYIKVEWITQ